MNFDANIKCIVVGPKGVGKTSLSTQFANAQYNPEVQPSQNVENHLIPFQIHQVNLVCIPGENFAMVREQCKDALVAFCVFDLTCPQSQEQLLAYINELKENMPQVHFLVIIGNKSDLAHEVNEEEVKAKLCKGGLYRYYSVNALEYGGLQNAAEEVIQYFHDKVNEMKQE